MGWNLKLAENIELIEPLPALYIKSIDAVVIADLHLGYEEAMVKQGVYLPYLQYSKISEIIKKSREKTHASKLIIAGDIKHEFSKLLKQEKLETARLISDAFRAGYKDIIVVRGNHDNFIGSLIENLGGSFVEEYVVDNILITHGHKDIECKYDYIIMGHEHPALQINLGGAKVKFSILLIVPLEDCGTAIILPASGTYQPGNNISMSRENYLSPIIRKRGILDESQPIIVDEQEGVMPLPILRELEDIVVI